MSTFCKSRQKYYKRKFRDWGNTSGTKTEKNRKRICFLKNGTIGGLEGHVLFLLFNISILLLFNPSMIFDLKKMCECFP